MMMRPSIAIAVALAVVAAPLAASAATKVQVLAWLAAAPGGARVTARPNTPAAQANPQAIPVALGRERDPAGFIQPYLVTHGYAAGGQEVMIMPIVSGGSGGVFSTVIYARVNGQVRYVATKSSGDGHLDVYLDGESVVTRSPIYGPGDANCCPSGHHYEIDALHGTRLVKTDSWDEGKH